MVKINSLEVENVKRIKAVKIEFTGNGMTVIGGNNGQGKTSVLDSICWVLGGNKKAPSNPVREGSSAPASITLTLSNGLTVERKGKNASLKITDPSGQKSGQSLLNSFISELALDLPKFINASSKEKAKILLAISGLEDELKQLDADEKELYDNRTLVGRDKDRKQKFAEEMPEFDDVPDAPVSASELIQSQQAVLARNGDNDRQRAELARLEARGHSLADVLGHKKSVLEGIKREVADLEEKKAAVTKEYRAQKVIVDNVEDESTELIEKQLADIDAINSRIRANMDREAGFEAAKVLKVQYDGLTNNIEDIRDKRMALLDSVDFPLPELSIADGELIYKGVMWDCMSGAEQLIVSASIARSLNKECGFVLMDKLEQMDQPTLKAFSDWLVSEDLQVIGTRVSTGEECSIIIEDGQVSEVNETPKKKTYAAFGE